MMESCGSGTLKIAAVCKAHHMQEPEFKQQSNYFSVTFFSNTVENEPENERYKMIIYEIRKNKFININQLATKMQVNRSTIKRDLAVLNDKGIIIRTGPANGGYWEILKK